MPSGMVGWLGFYPTYSSDQGLHERFQTTPELASRFSEPRNEYPHLEHLWPSTHLCGETVHLFAGSAVNELTY